MGRPKGSKNVVRAKSDYKPEYAGMLLEFFRHYSEGEEAGVPTLQRFAQSTGETDDKSALLSEIMGADKFGKARAYLSGLKAKENAEAPKDGWRSTIQKGLKGMGLTSDEQALMLYAAGYHSTSDLSAFLRVLNAKNLTKEQLALFAEIFKLDVKNGKLVERKSTKKTA